MAAEPTSPAQPPQLPTAGSLAGILDVLETDDDFRALIARGDEHAVDIQPEALRLRRFRRSGQGLYLYDRRLGRLHVRRLLRLPP